MQKSVLKPFRLLVGGNYFPSHTQDSVSCGQEALKARDYPVEPWPARN